MLGGRDDLKSGGEYSPSVEATAAPRRKPANTTSYFSMLSLFLVGVRTRVSCPCSQGRLPILLNRFFPSVRTFTISSLIPRWRIYHISYAPFAFSRILDLKNAKTQKWHLNTIVQNNTFHFVSHPAAVRPISDDLSMMTSSNPTI